MKRSAPMKRTAFKRAAPAPRPVKTYELHTPRVRDVARPGPAANAPIFNPVPKDNPLQHAAYMDAVRKLPCGRCGFYRPGLIQFCHADILGRGGKGKGLKSDCRLGWPGCAPHDDALGCHYLIGTAGLLPKQERHDFEARAGAETRAKVKVMGRWPASLPAWPGDTPCP